jgi:hypothetical protein
LIFTDAAQEGDIVTIGALLMDSQHAIIEYFASVVPQAIVSEWQTFQKQVIAQGELLPVLLAKLLWHKYLSERRVLLFVDNESVRYSLIKGSTSSASMQRMLLQSVTIDSEASSLTWVARVPSQSNPADAISRFDFAHAESMGAVRVEAPEHLMKKMALGHD